MTDPINGRIKKDNVQRKLNYLKRILDRQLNRISFRDFYLTPFYCRRFNPMGLNALN
jgi:hypothetical protein